jgi:septal ring factor EnvC (AmiA/AmiB activator)
MEKDLAEMTATEEGAIKDFSALVAAKEKEIGANTKAIESKTERFGQTGLEIVNLKEDLDDTTKGLYADRKFLADLDKNCATKKAEWEERSKTRAEELLALADTIKLLNDDDALELFKKTLPSPSLLQIKRTGAAVRKQALQLLKSAHGQKDPRMDLVMLALAGHGKSFDKVLKMIDEMVALLGKEQEDDDSKKAYCQEELDLAEDHKKEIDQTLTDLNKAIAHAEENIARLAEDIAALASGIKALDKSVAEATEQRKAENAEYKSTMAADQAAKELIGVAKNRLMKFYNPALHKAAPKVELSEQQRVAVNMGSEAAPTVAPSGIAGTGITYLQESAPVFVQVGLHSSDSSDVAPAPPPETWGAYQTKGQEKSGVVEMMNLLVADLDKEMTQMEVDEKDAQAEYETFMENSRAKRASDSKTMADKEGVKADLEAELQKAGEERKATLKEGMATAESIKDLHLTCDWLLANFEARKAARSGEVDSLKNAKAVLSGADYSLAQQSVRVLRSRSA